MKLLQRETFTVLLLFWHMSKLKNTKKKNTLFFQKNTHLREKIKKRTAVSCSPDDGLGLWSPVSHLSCEIWWNNTPALLSRQDPVAVFCIIHDKLMNCPFFYFFPRCVNCPAAHCIFSAVLVHLTVPAAANRWRSCDRLRKGVALVEMIQSVGFFQYFPQSKFVSTF